MQGALLLLSLARLLAARGKLHTRARRKLFERVAELETLPLHDEGESITRLMAREAVVALCIREDVEGRRARVRVERAEAGEITSRFPQLNAARPDQVDD